MASRRDNRQLEEGCFYHIYNRGNRKEDIVKEIEDYAVLVYFMDFVFQRRGEELLAYCFMPNHFHFLVKICNRDNFVKLMQEFASKSAKYYNNKYSTVGHLFQDKYKHRKIEDEADLLFTSRYIHRNPLGFEGVNESNLLEYQWFSLPSFISRQDTSSTPIVKSKYILNCFGSPNAYLNFNLGENFYMQLATLKSPEKVFNDLEKVVTTRISSLDY